MARRLGHQEAGRGNEDSSSVGQAGNSGAMADKDAGDMNSFLAPFALDSDSFDRFNWLGVSKFKHQFLGYF